MFSVVCGKNGRGGWRVTEAHKGSRKNEKIFGVLAGLDKNHSSNVMTTSARSMKIRDH